MKRIVICCDGTWNSPDKEQNGVPIATNVVKIARAVALQGDRGIRQMMYYDPGVGTSGSLIRRVFDGATGHGLSRNILETYRYLIASYEPGDELYFFGFSRGAFTVRSLAGLIRTCGILRPPCGGMVRQAFALYRSRSPSTHPRATEATLFRRTYAVADMTPIKFIGVWDTVGSLGNPLFLNGLLSRRYRFHDTDLSSIVTHACQALAIDEKRSQFHAALWHQQPHAQGQTLEQVWFAGVHSNVGGGYPRTGLSDLALDWMSDRVRGFDLSLDPIPTQPDQLQPRDESRKGFYILLPPFHRPISQPPPDRGATGETLHPSVVERYRRDPSYRPPNLEDYFSRFPASRPQP